MTTPMLLSLTLVAGLALGALDWHRRAKARARANRRSLSQKVSPDPEDIYDQARDPHWLDSPITEYEAAALWAELDRLDGGRAS